MYAKAATTVLVYMILSSSNLQAADFETFYLGKSEIYETPYFIFKGKKPGPIVLVEGCIHGNEPAGTLAMDRLKNDLHVDAGTLIMLPRMNIVACRANKRLINVDLNRVFALRQTPGPFEHRLANEIYNLVENHKVQFLLTTHESRKLWNPDTRQGLGQTICYGVKPPPRYLAGWVKALNAKLKAKREHFHPIYFPISTSSTEVMVEGLNLKGGFCLETWMGFSLERRVHLQTIAIKTFLDSVGLSYGLTHRRLESKVDR